MTYSYTYSNTSYANTVSISLSTGETAANVLAATLAAINGGTTGVKASGTVLGTYSQITLANVVTTGCEAYGAVLGTSSRITLPNATASRHRKRRRPERSTARFHGGRAGRGGLGNEHRSGASVSLGGFEVTVSRLSARLAIDPGVIVKLGGSNIETQIDAQMIAEGTASHPSCSPRWRTTATGRAGLSTPPATASPRTGWARRPTPRTGAIGAA